MSGLCWVMWDLSLQCPVSLAVVHELSSCGMRDLSSPTRGKTCVPCIARQIPNHWTTGEVLAYMLSCFSCVRLCYPMDYSPPGSSIHRILHARMLEWVVRPSSRGSIFQTQGSNPNLIMFPALEGWFFTTSATWEAPGWLILKERNCLHCRWILYLVVIAYSRGFSQPRDWTSVSCIGRQFLLSLHLVSPLFT